VIAAVLACGVVLVVSWTDAAHEDVPGEVVCVPNDALPHPEKATAARATAGAYLARVTPTSDGSAAHDRRIRGSRRSPLAGVAPWGQADPAARDPFAGDSPED
jgi:hypothetical protein